MDRVLYVLSTVLYIHMYSYCAVRVGVHHGVRNNKFSSYLKDKQSRGPASHDIDRCQAKNAHLQSQSPRQTRRCQSPSPSPSPSPTAELPDLPTIIYDFQPSERPSM